MMHTIWEWLTFWFRCLVDGLLSFKSFFGVIKSLLGIVTAAIYFRSKWSEKMAKWEKPLLAISFWGLLVVTTFYVLFVAPFQQYRVEYKAHHDEVSFDVFEKNMPRLEPKLFVDEIRKDLDEVDFHFEIANVGVLTAYVEEEVHMSGFEHSHDWPDGYFKPNVINPLGGKVVFEPLAPWTWQPQDKLWLVELRLTYGFVLGGKAKWVRSTYEFRIPRNSVRVREFLPAHAGLEFDPVRKKDMAAYFLSLSDVAGDFGLHEIGPLEPGAASNAVREFYIDVDTNTVRFYFHPANSKMIRLTNCYLQGSNVTNFIGAFWDDEKGAMLLVNSNMDAEPKGYWEEVMRKMGANVLDANEH